MTTKEFLSRAYRLDQRINAKISQAEALNDLATKCTSVITGMPRSPSSGKNTMTDVLVKIMDLQAEINNDIDELVDTKREIVTVVKRVENREYQVLLEKRYLCYQTWETISDEMHYGIRWTHVMHKRALAAVETILRALNKCAQ